MNFKLDAILAVAIGLINFLYQSMDRVSSFRKKDFEEWERFNECSKNFDDTTLRLEKDALLRTVGFLQSFTWKEYEYLRQKNISLNLLKSLHDLKYNKFLYFENDCFFIVSKKYAYFSLITISNILVLLSFLYSFGIFVLEVILRKNNQLGLLAMFYFIIFILAIFGFFNRHIRSYHVVINQLQTGEYTDWIRIDENFNKSKLNQ